MPSLSDKAGFLIIANLIKYTIGFMVPIVLVRMLNQHEYGSYQQILLVGTALVGIMTLGLPTSIYYFYHHVSAGRRPVLILQTVVMLAMTGLISGALVYLAAPFLAQRMNNPALTGLFSIYALYVVFFIASEHFIHFLISQNRYRLAVGFETGEAILRVGILFLPLFLGFGLVGLVWATVMYAVLRFTVRTSLILRESNEFAGQWMTSLFISEQLRYSFPLFLTSVVGLIGALLDKAIIAAFFTPVHFAIYSIGALEIPLDVIFQASVANVLRASLPPLVQEGNMAEVISIWREAVRKLAIIILPSFVFLLGFSYDFITLLFTNQYAESVFVFRIYLFLMPFNIFVFSMMPQVFGKTRINLYIAIGALVSHVALSFLLLWMYGFYGPALAGVIVVLFISIAYFVITMRLVKVTSVWALLPLASLLKILTVAILSLGMAYLVRGSFDAKWIDFMACAVTYSVGFLALATWSGVFTEEDKRLMRRWIAKILPWHTS
ncbi:MAG: oligosaccharide flippase family protein [Sulfuricaulis sp.]